jgi:branched-chain amino acid aminotransferase
MVEKTLKIWMDGKLVDFDDAKVHVLTHTLHYGLGAFEGIRAYPQADGTSAIFRLREHIRRLFDSCHIVGLEVPFTQEEVCQACVDLVKANRLTHAYIRPLVYLGMGAMGLKALENPVCLSIISWKWGTYLGEDALNQGIRTKVSSMVRHGMDSSMVKAKISGYYANAIMAKREALAGGYDEAIMLDQHGHVAEGPGENIFLVKNQVLQTPPYSSAVLGGITRDSIIVLARELGYRVKPQLFSRDELYIADEAFFTGTAAELTPIVAVDDRRIGGGTPGPVTKTLQARFFDILKGRTSDHAEWLTKYKI